MLEWFIRSLTDTLQETYCSKQYTQLRWWFRRMVWYIFAQRRRNGMISLVFLLHFSLQALGLKRFSPQPWCDFVHSTIRNQPDITLKSHDMGECVVYVSCRWCLVTNASRLFKPIIELFVRGVKGWSCIDSILRYTMGAAMSERCPVLYINHTAILRVWIISIICISYFPSNLQIISTSSLILY